MKLSRFVTSPQNEHGWTLPTTLFGLALLLSTVHLVNLESIGGSQILSEIKRGEKLHNEALKTISSTPPLDRRCSKQAASYGEFTSHYEVCGEGVSPFITFPSSVTFPFLNIDYDVLFVGASPCSTPSAPSTLPKSRAPRASTDCFVSAKITGGATLLDNIVGGSITMVPAAATVSLLATPGALLITNELLIEQDLLVVAGGNVEIGTLTTNSSSYVKVTVISTRGSVSIGKATGKTSLLIAGRGSLSAPETPISAPFPLPPLRAPSIYGFRAVY